MTAGPPGPDLLDTGQPRPPRRWVGRRGVRVAAGVLAAVAALGLVRVSLGDRPPGRSAVASASPSATPPAVVAPDPRTLPPFDRRPGRTPIPEPAATGDQLSGPLPPTGAPARGSAARAADLVIGRYCADPTRYTLSLDDLGGWREVRVFLVDLERSNGPVAQWSLYWTGTAYRWVGSIGLLRGC